MHHYSQTPYTHTECKLKIFLFKSFLRLVCRIDSDGSELDQSLNITIEVNEKRVESGYSISGDANTHGFSFVVRTSTFSLFHFFHKPQLHDCLIHRICRNIVLQISKRLNIFYTSHLRSDPRNHKYHTGLWTPDWGNLGHPVRKTSGCWWGQNSPIWGQNLPCSKVIVPGY